MNKKVLISTAGGGAAVVLAIGALFLLTPEQEALEALDPGTTEIVEVAEVCNEENLVYTIQILDGKLKGQTSNNCPLDYMKVLDEGQEVYEVTKTQFENINAGYDVTVVDGVVSTSKGSKAIAKEAAKVKSDNEALYRQIGEAEVLKIGKESAGVSTSKEDAKIEALKLEIQ